MNNKRTTSVLLLAIFVSTILAGCSSSPNSSTTGVPSTTDSRLQTTTTAPAPKFTDLLFFKAAPELVLAFPNLAQFDATPFAQSGFPVEWAYTPMNSGTISSYNATLWFRVPPNAVNPSSPTSGTCPFTLLAGVRSEEGNVTLFGASCDGGELLATGGDVQVNFTIQDPGAGVQFTKDDAVVVQIQTRLITSPFEPVTLLSSAAPYRSSITFVGLAQESAAGLLGQGTIVDSRQTGG